MDDPQFPPVGGRRAEKLRERCSKPGDGPVCGGVGDAERESQLLQGEVGPVGKDDQQDWAGDW
ncbi:hypothetical protein [Streptomyces sp. CA-106110]|uniref:hypothetical protein n=1 Tax=Streptomyces sp. CA-106110 TaxID=3240044 RepID=UPI003D92AC8E